MSIERHSNFGKKLHPFLFVGCWNKRSDGHDRVKHDIMTERDEKILILGGDNAYPEKKINSTGKLMKVFNTTYTKNEINSLAKPGLFKFVALGNHNIENEEILQYELNGAKKKDRGWILPSNYYSFSYTDNYSIIVLDTNLVDEEPAFNSMLLWLQTMLEYLKGLGRPYYLIQHEPFLSHKTRKGGQTPNKIQSLAKGEKILEILLLHPPIFILCADTHNYQTVDIQYNSGERLHIFHQIVVGTGGAEPDPIDDSYGDFGLLKFTGSAIRTSFRPGYGFLAVSLEDRPVAKFILSAPWLHGGKYRTRVSRRRKK